MVSNRPNLTRLRVSTGSNCSLFRGQGARDSYPRRLLSPGPRQEGRRVSLLSVPVAHPGSSSHCRDDADARSHCLAPARRNTPGFGPSPKRTAGTTLVCPRRCCAAMPWLCKRKQTFSVSTLAATARCLQSCSSAIRTVPRRLSSIERATSHHPALDFKFLLPFSR